jgi:hypothetical protein
MPDEVRPPSDTDPINFSFRTYGDLKEVYGPKQAARMLAIKQKREAMGAGAMVPLSALDIDIALRFLRGEKVGAQSSKALKAFRNFFASSDASRKACESYLLRLQKQDGSNSKEAIKPPAGP